MQRHRLHVHKTRPVGHHKRFLLEQEVPGAEVLYEAGNDTCEVSRGLVTCHAKQLELCPIEGFSAVMKPDWIICKKILLGQLLGVDEGYERKSTAAVAITRAREAQILNLAFSVGISEKGRSKK